MTWRPTAQGGATASRDCAARLGGSASLRTSGFAGAREPPRLPSPSPHTAPEVSPLHEGGSGVLAACGERLRHELS
ncbi:hypothetical protein NDU88_006599 [Pleurodeles waltl]|uniref:Uncharacterized protein n=1 Tax=Pleurodeles waltl TaxID=8319 RepID=A0AAV7TXM1_PLEWA|nr:hypothetical protein NDU88_006599 [Pleurodeles waltl]